MFPTSWAKPGEGGGAGLGGVGAEGMAGLLCRLFLQKPGKQPGPTGSRAPLFCFYQQQGSRMGPRVQASITPHQADNRGPWIAVSRQEEDSKRVRVGTADLPPRPSPPGLSPAPQPREPGPTRHTLIPATLSDLLTLTSLATDLLGTQSPALGTNS